MKIGINTNDKDITTSSTTHVVNVDMHHVVKKWFDLLLTDLIIFQYENSIALNISKRVDDTFNM